jgi:hypothetical protein
VCVRRKVSIVSTGIYAEWLAQLGWRLEQACLSCRVLASPQPWLALILVIKRGKAPLSRGSEGWQLRHSYIHTYIHTCAESTQFWSLVSFLCSSCAYHQLFPRSPQDFNINRESIWIGATTTHCFHDTIHPSHQQHKKMAMAAQTSSSPSSPPRLRIQTRPRRLSKFTEGSELTRPELLQRTPTSNSHFFHILSEMDAHEAARRRSPTSPPSHNHRNSNSSSTSSVESFGSPSPDKEREFTGVKEGRRSINFGRKSLSLEDRPMEIAEKVRGIKGRLRALTGGRNGDVKPYPGT